MLFRAVLVSLALASSASAAPTTYRIDPAKTKIFLVMMKAPSMASSFSHDHVFRAADVAGEVVWDAANPAAARLRVAVKAGTLEVDDPKVRERFGLQGIPSERDVAAIAEDMRGPEFLDVQRHPEVSFTSTGVKPADDGRLLLTGNLTLKGRTRAVELPVSVTQSDAEVSGVGRLVVKQSDFGIKPCNKFLGAVKCGDEVVMHLVLVGKR